MTRRVEEAYSGRTVIKAFTQEKNSRKDMEEAVEELARTSRKADFMMNVVNPFILSLIHILSGKYQICRSGDLFYDV